MNLDDQLDNNLGGLEVNSEARGFLLETSKWAKFFAVLTGIVIVLMVGAMLIMLLSAPDALSSSYGAEGIFVFIMYMLMGVLYVMPTVYLYRFANKTKAAITESNSLQLADGLENLKSLFKFMGVMTILLLAFYVLALFAGGMFFAMS